MATPCPSSAGLARFARGDDPDLAGHVSGRPACGRIVQTWQSTTCADPSADPDNTLDVVHEVDFDPVWSTDAGYELHGELGRGGLALYF